MVTASVVEVVVDVVVGATVVVVVVDVDVVVVEVLVVVVVISELHPSSQLLEINLKSNPNPDNVPSSAQTYIPSVAGIKTPCNTPKQSVYVRYLVWSSAIAGFLAT